VPGSTLQGSFTLQNQNDLETLNRYSELTGNLTVAEGLAHVVLPNLLRIGGALNVQTTQTLVELALPALATVGGQVTLERNTALNKLALCALKQAAGFRIGENDALTAPEFRH